MRKCVRCNIAMVENCGIKVKGAAYGLVLTDDENIVENNHIHDTAEIFKTYTPGVNMHGAEYIGKGSNCHPCT